MQKQAAPLDVIAKPGRLSSPSQARGLLGLPSRLRNALGPSVRQRLQVEIEGDPETVRGHACEILQLQGADMAGPYAEQGYVLKNASLGCDFYVATRRVSHQTCELSIEIDAAPSRRKMQRFVAFTTAGCFLMIVAGSMVVGPHFLQSMLTKLVVVFACGAGVIVQAGRNVLQAATTQAELVEGMLQSPTLGLSATRSTEPRGQHLKSLGGSFQHRG